MARLIDADELWRKTFICEDAADVRKEIETAPTVEAAPVVHGRWNIADYGHYCSVCGRFAADYNRTCYCPNCGAKMK